MSVEKLITENLELWTGAITQKSASGRGSSSKRELTGIKKLRELILELAVRGKLVPQNRLDVPAETIVRQLAVAKKRLISEGTIKAGKPLEPLPHVDDGHSPVLPQGWAWVRLGQTMEMYNGRAFKSSEWATNGTPIVRIQNLNDPLAPTNFIDAPVDPKNLIDDGTFLISWSGTPGTSFGAFIWRRGKAALNQHINKCEFFGDYLDKRFMQIAVNGQMAHFIQQAQGGVGLKHVTKGVLNNALIGLPPLAEQHRIVQKVDELMALCDLLEQQTFESIEAHERLVDTLLDTLARAANATELAENWGRVQQHFDTLLTTEHSIDRLKQTILQLAVMGRLVPQDPDDDSVPSILEGVASMRKDLRAKKKISPDKVIVDDPGLVALKAPIPQNWKWCRLADIATVVRGGSPRPAGDPRFYEGDIPFLKVADVTRAKGKFVEGYTATIKEAGLSKTRFIDVRTVLLSNSGATLGIPAICDFPATFNDGIAAFIYLADGVDDEFLHLYLRSKSQWFIEFASRGQGQPNLNTDIIRATWFPLPPLEEQQRIVARVDELMTMCDSLNMQFCEANETLGQLASVVVEQVVQ